MPSTISKDVLAVAKLGLIALIDEATGYQSVREKDALKKKLEEFQLEEVQKEE